MFVSLKQDVKLHPPYGNITEITKYVWLEKTSKGHLVQPPYSSKGAQPYVEELLTTHDYYVELLTTQPLRQCISVLCHTHSKEMLSTI